MKIIVITLILWSMPVWTENLPKFDVSWMQGTVIVGESHEISLKLWTPLDHSITVNFTQNQLSLTKLQPDTISIPKNVQNSNFTIKIDALKAGSVEVTATANPVGILDVSNLFFKITIGNSKFLIILSIIVGWIYFVAWTVNSYPQIWLNFTRKSVIGLSFDFLALNLTGHVVYSVFNAALYYSKYFEDEYLRRFPHGQNPVELNDVFASIHGVGEYVLIVFQCFIYERGSQRVSTTTWSILFVFFVVLSATSGFCTFGHLHWLDFLYMCSYIKLAVTLVKYVPQVIMNYKRKSTVGWSIENILLDITGGVLSIMQMIINSYNYDDWQSNFGNPTKILLGIITIIFDLIFIIQHYCLYNNDRHPMMTENSNKGLKNAMQCEEVQESVKL